MLSFGTMAHAALYTITQTLYYTGNNTGPENDGVGTSVQNYIPPSAGDPSGVGLLGTTWDASFTFNDFGFYNVLLPLYNVTVSVVQSTTGDETLAQTSTRSGFYAYGVGTDAVFTTDSAFNNTIFGADSLVVGSDPGTSTVPGPPSLKLNSCSGTGDPSLTNGSTDSTGCVYLVQPVTSSNPTGGTPSGVFVSGYANVASSDATNPITGTDAGGNLANSNFAGSGTSSIYEEVEGLATITGADPDTLAPDGSAAGTEITLTFTYGTPDVPEPATLLLLGTGLSFVASRLRRKKVAAE
jgi:hypothetical protein